MAEDRQEIRARCRLPAAFKISKVNQATSDRWAQLGRQVVATGDAQLVHRELVSVYSQPSRHYHNLRHISECLAEFDTVRHLVSQPVAVELAIWFHDAVYDPRAQDNEEKSAQLAKRRIVKAGGSADLCNSVAALVLATKAHDPSQHPDAPLLVDADLSILGQSEERFRLKEEGCLSVVAFWLDITTSRLPGDRAVTHASTHPVSCPITGFDRPGHFLGRHWLKVRPLPDGAVKSSGRGSPGADMQRQASVPLHFNRPCWMWPLHIPSRL